MATAAKPGCETFSFSGEDAGVAAAAALRKVRPLTESAPIGRLFSSIQTLADTSSMAADAYEAAGLAELRAETEKAQSHIQRGNRLTKRLKESFTADLATPLPAFARYK